MSSIVEFRRPLLAVAAAMLVSACATTGGAQIGAAPTRRPTTNPARPIAPLARADSPWEAGSYPLAADLYEAIVAREPSSRIATFRLATLRSWDNRFEESIALFRRYVTEEPSYTEGRLSLARVLAWSGDYSGAIAIYDSVLTREPANRGATLGRAQTLAWSERLSEALAVYIQWTVAHPSDREAAIEYARALSWNGQMGAAESMYAELAKTGNANAKKGLARVISWRGDLDRSEETWRQVLVTDPNDVEELTGLAQVLSWQGRQGDAETALQHALRVNPGNGDARALMRLVQADLRPSVTVSATGTNDSDDNPSTNLQLDYVVRAPWNGSIGARYAERWANFAAIDSRADAGNFFARWQPASSSWQLRADAGVTHHYSTFVSPASPNKTIVNVGLRVTGNLARSLSVGLLAARTPFDETALLIANGVVSDEFAGEAALALPGRFTLSGAGSHARLTGGTLDNSRNAYSSTLRWMYNRRWSLAIGGRQFGYDTTSSDGYFAPKKYTLAEVSGRARLGGDLGWNAEADAGVGQQRIEFFGSSAGSRAAERVALTAGYRFDPAHEISASGGYANVAGPGQTSGGEDRDTSFSLPAGGGF